MYTVQPGDTVASIAAQELGNAFRWPEIAGINRETVPDPDFIEVGQRLFLT